MPLFTNSGDSSPENRQRARLSLRALPETQEIVELLGRFEPDASNSQATRPSLFLNASARARIDMENAARAGDLDAFRTAANEGNAAFAQTAGTNTQPRTAGRRRPRETATATRGAAGNVGGPGSSDASGGADASGGPGGSGRTVFNRVFLPLSRDSGLPTAYLEDLPVAESLQLPASFALPILGSRDLTDLFNEIFDTSRQEPRRSRVRRDEAQTATGRGGGARGAVGSMETARDARFRSTTRRIRELEVENQQAPRSNFREMMGLYPSSPGSDPPPSTRIQGASDRADTPGGEVAHASATSSSGKLARSPPNWFLKPGQTWNGWQHVQHWPPGTSERWSVRVVLDFVNFEKGEVFGTMTASNVPGAENNVVTYFEGEIIDNENSTFYSNPDASARTCLAELRHWSRFPSFRPLRDSVLEEDGRAPALSESGKVFMRWKEKCFLSGGHNCRLSIAGLYYVTLDRVNGDIHAYYWDPNSAPEQKMNLKVGSSHQQGYALPVYKFA